MMLRCFIRSQLVLGMGGAEVAGKFSSDGGESGPGEGRSKDVSELCWCWGETSKCIHDWLPWQKEQR